MNKTININLGGFFFHIDENAYQKLKRYLDAISRSLSDDPQGKNEIIADIEARISELLSERITDARQVVNEGDIEEIIAIMGQPEDYSDGEEAYAENGIANQLTLGELIEEFQLNRLLSIAFYTKLNKEQEQHDLLTK